MLGHQIILLVILTLLFLIDDLVVAKIKSNFIPDAAESNAGDNFHLVWAVRKSLELLNFSPKGLMALSLESVGTTDAKKVDPKSMLGVDLTEYYGGTDLKTASKVVISQLKYSTRHVAAPWTAALICQGKKQGSSGSVIDRLGSLYKELIIKFPGQQHKLTVRLVSNRPASADLLDTIKKIKDLHQQRKTLLGIGTLINKLDTKQRQVVNRLVTASTIDTANIVGFLLALDFSDCNAASSAIQKVKSYEIIARFGSMEGREQFAKLKEMIGERMLPGKRGNNTLYKGDILMEFGFNALSDLFPVSNNILIPAKLVARDQLQHINEVIIDPDTTILCLHGRAGIGKSTLMSSISAYLPLGSQSILFDCYGGSSYSDTEDRRHEPGNAFLQLSNDLALLCGTPFLLLREGNTGHFLKEFKKRIVEALALIRKDNPVAILAFLIDAADNSVSAAHQFQSESFINELAGMGLPEGCKAVFSCRTERKDTLALPANARYLEIAPFTVCETQQFLSGFYTNADEQQATDFQQLTYGIPRVMANVMDMKGASLSEKTAFLRPSGKTLEQIFLQHIVEAGKRSGDAETVTRFLTALTTLPRPVPETFLKTLAGLTDGNLSDLRTDLWHGLVYENGNYLFADEDYETFVRTRYPATQDEYLRVADILLKEAESSDYASIHLGSFLHHANLKDELVEIVTGKKLLKVPADPIKNKEIFIERVRLAMRMTKSGDMSFYKLQFIAAEAAKSNDIIENILLNHAELAAAYGDLQTNQKLYFQSGNPHWFGPAHFRNAAIYSRNPLTHQLAREHLDKAGSWLNYRDHLNDDEQKNFEFSSKDIAYGAEAVLRIFGVKRCAAYIKSWSPRTFGFDILEDLLKILIPATSNKQLNNWLKAVELPNTIRIAAVNLFFRYGLKVGFAWRDVFDEPRYLLWLGKKMSLRFQDKLLGFLEFALMQGVSYEVAQPLLEIIRIKYPTHFPGFYNSSMNDSAVTELDFLFRRKALEKHLINGSYNIVDFYAESMRAGLASNDHKTKNKYVDEQKKFDRLYRHLLDIYGFRAKILLSKTTGKTLISEISGIVKRLNDDWELRYYNEYQFQRMYEFMMLKLLDAVFYSKGEGILNVINQGFSNKKVNNISIKLKLAARLSHRSDFHDFVLRLLQDVEQTVNDSLLPGSEIIDYYKRATIIASRISKAEGKYYFDKMVLASNEIDEEAYDQIRSIQTITEGCIYKDPELAHDYARFVEYCSKKLGDGEYFPWDEGIKAISAMDNRSLWPIICRWDHRYTRKQKEHITQVTLLSFQAGLIDKATAAGLLSLNPYFVYGINKLVEPIIAAANADEDKLFKTAFVQDLLEDIKLHSNPGSDFSYIGTCFELLKDGKYIDRQLVLAFQNHINQLESLIGPLERKTDNERKRRIFPLPAAIKKQLKRISINKHLDLGEVLRALQKQSKNGYVQVNEVLAELRAQARNGGEQFFLDALLQLNENSISYYDYERALTETMNDWQHLAVMKTWPGQAFPLIITNWFQSLIAYRSLDYATVKRLQQLFKASDQQLADLVNKIFPEQLADLSAGVLYNLFRLSISGINETEKQHLVRWAVTRWCEPIPVNFGDGIFTDAFLPPEDGRQLVRKLLQYNFGHPVRAVRWRSGYGLRRLIRYGCTWIVPELLENSGSKSIGQFQDKHNLFFWMSSRLYLFIFFERAVKESPTTMKPYAQAFLQELSDNSLPHAQIKFFIRSTCLFLLKKYPDLYSPVEQNLIHSALSPVKRFTRPKEGPKKRRRRGEGNDELSFAFDSMDTIPYWYDGLADVFDLSTNDLLKIIDRFITEDWGFTGNARELNHVEADYGETQNDHGAEPRVEDLRTYFEYHGMFCAAFEILKSKGALKKSSRESWESWIAGWGLCWPDRWLGDLRDPIPLENRFWIKKSPDSEWEYSVQPADFHERTGTGKSFESLTLEEHSYVYFGKDKEEVRISSGLVDITTAPALLAVLQSVPSYDSYIPHKAIFSEDIDDELAGLNKKFLTDALVTDLENQQEGIDDRDKKFNDILKHRLLPSPMLRNVLKLEGAGDDRVSYKKNSPAVEVTNLRVWNNTSNERHYDGFTTSGHRFTITKDALLELLQARNRCLILNCQIGRDLDGVRHEEYLPDNCLIYLIYPNGIAHTITGNHSIR